MSPALFLTLQRLLPKQLLTEALGALAGVRGGAATHWAIRRFIARYQVDMSEAADPDPVAYASFNEFFTRPLAAGARPLARAQWLCPVDGAVSQCGPIEDQTLLQAKGHRYSLAALLADPSLASRFSGGAFATLYLSPRDYHRIHMPAAGRLLSMTHVPGSLYSVNPVTVEGIPDLFARNERLVCLFERAGEPFAMVLVGATIVGRIETVWHGLVNAPRVGAARTWRYNTQPVDLAQGAEMGRFLLGSTVILVVPASTTPMWPAWPAGRPVRLGEAMTA
jgi:phosphatidylserine decarboxylase